MIFFDVETTGLPLPSNVPLDRQPEIIEFAAIKIVEHINEEGYSIFREADRLEFFCKHSLPELPPKITELTGITDQMLADADAKPFHWKFRELAKFFTGETELIAHNLEFDKKMLEFGLARADKVTFFPWPRDQYCTMEHYKQCNDGRWISLDKLYKIATGKQFEGHHRAMNDVKALVDIVAWMQDACDEDCPPLIEV